jgi:hypothetical protein
MRLLDESYSPDDIVL